MRKWTVAPDQDCTADKRGWEKGKFRDYRSTTAEQVLGIKIALLNAASYFYGPQEVQRIYRQKYPAEKLPTVDFIKRVCREHDLTRPVISRSRGRSAYQHYPAFTIAHLAASLSELDFVGEKNISRQTEPVSFIAYNSLKPFRFREYAVVAAQTSQEAVRFLEVLWQRIPAPEILKVDNDLAFIGSASGKRSLSRFVVFLLTKNVRPLFINPRSPWNNGSIEGSNSVFGSKFWNRYTFTSVADIKRKLVGFNRACNAYLGFSDTLPLKKKHQRAEQLYFIRKVVEQADEGKIDILNEQILLPKAYINQYVFCEWNVVKQILKVQYEQNQKLTMVRKLNFTVNSRMGWTRLFAP